MKTQLPAPSGTPPMPLKGQWSQAAARWEYRPENRSARRNRRRERVNLLVRGAAITGTLALSYWLADTLLPREKPVLPPPPSRNTTAGLVGSTLLSLVAGWLLRSSLRPKTQNTDAPA